MFEKIFSLFNKVNRGISEVNQMQNTVDSVINQKDRVAGAKSKGFTYTIVVIVIIIVAVLYIIYS